ncbi:hypothetical protein ABMA75_03145 [Halobacteriovorax sp. ZH4_bin.1]|uniref:hypothetical protein n=1 Tax=unclassified Halobacteriovorax TaxID=2639665 RepID=UPI003718602A
MKIISTILISLTMLFAVSCNKKDAKEMTAKGLAQGITKVLDQSKAIQCPDVKDLYAYVEMKSCEALKVDCEKASTMALASVSDTIKKVACKSAITIVGPMILPGRYLPGELKDAGCKMDLADELVTSKLSKVCDRI